MPHYAIGDIQGCYDELQALLATINFDPERDRLWLAGDLVNRGPQSLEVLRFLYQLPQPARIVLGNHDLHLLGVVVGVRPIEAGDTLQTLLAADDCQLLCDWLRSQSLMVYDSSLGYAMTHAGIPPQWDLQQALVHAEEVQDHLQSEDYVECLQHLEGNEPAQWDESLQGWQRIRLIVNYFTRMRFCDPQGGLVFSKQSLPDTAPEGSMPWFSVPTRKTKNDSLIFGHWAALGGEVKRENVYALDTGCVWGGSLTAMRLEDKAIFQVPSQQIITDKGT